MTGTEKELPLYGGKELPYQRAKKGTEHALAIEQAFWFGQYKDDAAGTRATGGVLELIEEGNSYIQAQNGPLTGPDVNEFARNLFSFGSTEKVVFAGGLFIQAVNEIARGQILMAPNETSYGMKIQKWNTIFGTMNIVHVPAPVFVDSYAGYAFGLDMDSFAYRFLVNRDTKLEMNIQPPGTDAEYDQYISEVGLERRQAPRHALLKNVQA